MSFSDVFKSMDYGSVKTTIAGKDASDVERALDKERLTHDDLLALISEAAVPYIEDMAQRANAITHRRFGNVMNLYAPLYLSNECTNTCIYCGFNTKNDVPRVTLSVEEALKEAEILYDARMRDILLVSGEAPKIVTLEYLRETVKRLAEKFASVALEVYPMSTEEYATLVDAGCDGLTVYQETYNEDIYAKLHLGGKKRDFFHRLETADRGGEASIRRIGIGILMGLSDFRTDAAYLAAHAAYLIKRYWRSKISVSFPRLRPAEGGFMPDYLVTDRDLTQVITAFRIYLNDVGIVLSTREKKELRDNLAGLGITQMSAGSRTNPGGYTLHANSCEQFEVEDTRTPAEVSRKLASLGYDPVFKDWQTSRQTTEGTEK